MRRTQTIFLATLLGASISAPALAQDGPLDARSIRPAVMLLVDTSGSMERIPDDGSNPSCDECVPACTGDTLIDRNNKTRWALTVEALTGSIENYQCTAEDRSSYQSSEYDYGYYLPHINFTSNMTQASDGILDSFATRVKFGLMTFDGVGTTLGGDTLVPYNNWFADDGFRTAANGGPGMYSYGDVGRLAFPGCRTDYGINAGARGPGSFPGALLSVGLSDNVDDITAINSRVQQSLLQVRPFGGTPIAAMLDDLKYYLDNNADINSTGDALYACRQRKAILITDGAPDAMFRDSRFNCGIDEADPTNPSASCTAPNTHPTALFPNTGCSCPYKTPEQTAHILMNEGKVSDLIVVAYNVHDPVALANLNSIGQAVGFERDPSSLYRFLVQADGAGELKQRLDELLNASQPGVTSRSIPVSVSTGDLSMDGNTKRFDVTAGFQVGRNTAEPWAGLLYRGRAICRGTAVNDEPFSTSQGDVFHEILTGQAANNQRVMLTVTPETYGPVNGTLVNRSYAPVDALAVQETDSRNYQSSTHTSLNTSNVRRPDGGNFGTSDLVPTDSTVTPSQGTTTDRLNLPNVASPNFIDGSALNPLYFGDATRDNIPGTTADRTAIVNHVYGRGRPNALADIYHSQPTVMAPVNLANVGLFSSSDAEYNSWLRSLASTTTASHYSGDGRPGVVFVGTNDGTLHAFNLDTWGHRGTTIGGGRELWAFAPPALFGKMASMLDTHQTGFDGSPQVKDVVLQRRAGRPGIYRSILVSALRGAPSYLALDVTFPEAPVFLWQTSFPDVGNTIGNVGLTQVGVSWNNEEQVRAVAILPGGEGVACGLGGSVSPVSGRTRAEFPRGNQRDVRCWNRRGRSLYVVDVATGQLIQEFGPEHFPSPLTGSVAVDGVGVEASSAAYVFDHDGVLWRLSMLGSNPQNWMVKPIFDMFADPPPPSTPAPTWQLGRRPLFAPTLLRDKTGNLVIVAGTGDADSPRDSATQRVVSLTERRIESSDGQINAEIRVNWQIDLNQNESVTGPLTVFQDSVYFGTFESGSTQSLCSLGTSRLWGAHAYLSPDPRASVPVPTPRLPRRNGAASDPMVLSEDSSGSGLLLGVTLKQQPTCQGSARTYNAVTGQSVPTSPPSGGAYQLTGVMAGGSSGGENRGGDVSNGAITQMQSQTLQDHQQVKVTSWASMFE